LVLILAVAGYFYLHNLGTDYITLWDEAVHINVVKNLSQDPWPPKLHLTDIGIDFQDWTNNYVWVHKPLAPLYLQAVFYKISPTLFAFRLPAVLFALMSIIALFFVARRHFSYQAGIIASSLFAFNSYVFEQVKGRQFSGLHDLMFIFFGILALDRILKIVNDRSRKNYLWFGLFVGLGFLSKGGLALFFFPVLLIISLAAQGRKQAILNFLYAALVALAIVFPEKLVLLLLYPQEYFFEQNLQSLHLFKDLEYWGRPWDYYFTVYMRDLFLPYLYLPTLFGVVFGAYRSRIDKRLLVLVIWVLSFVVPLSFGLTKISNFIFAAMPAILILLALMFEYLWSQKKYAVMFGLSATAVLSYAIIRLDLWRVKYHFFQDETAFQRFAILIYAGLAFAALWIIFRILEKFWSLGVLSKGLAVLSIFLILGTYARANQLSDLKAKDDDQYQQQVKAAALEARGKYPKNAIFLLHYPKLLKSHLYFQYWSGLDAMEIYDRQPIFILKRTLPQNRPLFVLSIGPLKALDLELIQKQDFGYVYRLKL